jgi:hypothetical protein
MNDKHRTVGMLGDLRAHRTQQQAGETAVAATSDHEHHGSLAGLQQSCPRVRGTRVPCGCLPGAGFGESGADGISRQDDVLALAREYGMRLLGPNCIGLLNTDPAVRLDATFGDLPDLHAGGLGDSGGPEIVATDAATAAGLVVESFDAVLTVLTPVAVTDTEAIRAAVRQAVTRSAKPTVAIEIGTRAGTQALPGSMRTLPNSWGIQQCPVRVVRTARRVSRISGSAGTAGPRSGRARADRPTDGTVGSRTLPGAARSSSACHR